MESQQLLVLPKKEEVRYSTPFEEFIAGVYGRIQKPSRTSMQGAAQWGAFPLEQALAYGLWNVMIRIGEKIGAQLDSERVVLETVAPVVNRLVNAGLALSYGSIDHAAADFCKEVVAESEQELLRSSVQRQSRPQQTALLQNLVHVRVSAFFAKLIKKTQEKRKEIQELYQDLHASLFVPESSVTWIKFVDYDKFDNALALLDPLQKGDYSPRDEAVIYRHLVGDLAKELRLSIDRIDVYSILPIKLRGLPQEVKKAFSAGSIETNWVSTQVMLELLGITEDREHITHEEHRRAASIAMKLIPADLATRALERVERLRHFAITGSLRSKLLKYMTDSLEEQLSLAWDKSLGMCFEPFVLIPLDAMTLDEEDAAALLTGHNQELLSGLDLMAPKDRDAYLRKEIFDKVDWKAVDADELIRSFTDKLFPEEMLFDGLALIRPDDVDRIVLTLMLTHIFSLEFLEDEIVSRDLVSAESVWNRRADESDRRVSFLEGQIPKRDLTQQEADDLFTLTGRTPEVLKEYVTLLDKWGDSNESGLTPKEKKRFEKLERDASKWIDKRKKLWLEKIQKAREAWQKRSAK